ncbi:MAG: hypothetical protein ACI4O7_10995 [Aristaeellaceae bacterium]
MRTSNISCRLLQRRAEAAWEQGDRTEALRMSGYVDAMMLEGMRRGRQRAAGAEEVPSSAPAEGTERQSAGEAAAAPGVSPDAGREGAVL